MRVAAIAWCVAIPGLQVYIFRRTLPDLWKNHMEGPKGFPSLLAAWVVSGFVKIIFSHPGEIRFGNGSKIFLCHCQHEKDVFSYQGAEIHVLMVDELTQWAVSMYKYLRGRVRMIGIKLPPEYVGMFPRVLAGANPGGIGHNWVKGGWISGSKPLDIRRMPKEEGGMLRQYIPALMEDNPSLTQDDPEYGDRLEGLGNPALVKAMRRGIWDIVSGGALDDVWVDGVGIILPRFKVPATWRADRSFDWGSTHPFSVVWWAQADGTEAVLPDGRKFCPPRGSLIACHEWYGSKGDNVGLKMPPGDIAKGIKERELALLAGKWLAAKPSAGPADNEIRAVKIPGTPTLESSMAAEGIRWTESDKAPGTRKIGLELTRERLAEARKAHPEKPAMYFMDHCVGLIEHLPVLPRDKNDPDDVDTNAEDHDYDATRYRVLAAKPAAMSLKMGVVS